MSRAIAVPAIVAAVVSATVAAAPGGAPAVVCGSIIVPVDVTGWRPKRVVLGVISAPAAHIPQTVESGDAQWPFWSKAGIVIRANSAPVTVSVPRAWRKRAAVGWGNVEARSSLRFETCPDSSSVGGWNPYSGGFVLKTKSACLPLAFRVGDRTATLRFGVGRRCG